MSQAGSTTQKLAEVPFIHPSAEVSGSALVGEGTRIWNNARVREDARIGRECILGTGVYIGAGVRVGDRCKLENYALVYEGSVLEDGVFVGPQVVFTNDLRPRAVNPNGHLKTVADWTMGRILVRYAASVGARSVVVTGVTIGRFAMVGAGSVVTRDVPDHALVYGNPARLRGWVCACGSPLNLEQGGAAQGWCDPCGAFTTLPTANP